MKVFCDMDGVLTDFPRAYNDRFGLSIPLELYNERDFSVVIGKDAVAIDTDLDHDFWANLPWMPDGRKLLHTLEAIFGTERICLLTYPSHNPDGARGKIEWVRRHLPKYSSRLILAMDKRFCASVDAILFDDKPRNVTEFNAAGGCGVLVPAPWNCADYQENTMGEFLEELLGLYRSGGNTEHRERRDKYESCHGPV